MVEITKKKNAKRLLHLDILRVLAIFLVVFNHTGERGFMLFSVAPDSPFYFFYMMCSVLCKVAVPIFFMISGALLLPKEESLKQLFSKRILRMVVVLILVSIPYYFWLHGAAEGIGILDFLIFIYGNSASTSLWYLYSYIGLLLLLPFLRSMVKNLKTKDYMYLAVGHLVLVGVLPCLDFFLFGGNVALNEAFSSVIFVSQNVFFALMGYFLEHVLDQKYFNKKFVWLSVALSLVGIGTTCLMTYVQAANLGMCSGEQQEAYFNLFICIPAMTVYFIVKLIGSKITGSKVQRGLSVLGASVFGVYLIEKIIRALTSFVYTMASPFIGSFAASLVWVFVTCGMSFAFIITLKHIPYVKKVVNWFI